MKTRQSLGNSEKQTRRWETRTRRRLSLNSNQPPSASIKCSEEPMEFEQTEIFPKDENLKENTRTRRGRPSCSLYSSLTANNRDLAIALEKSRIKHRAVELANNELKKQVQTDRADYLEKVRELETSLHTTKERVQREAADEVRHRFEQVRVLLEDAIAAMLAGSNLLASAMSLVSGFDAETNVNAQSTLPDAATDICNTTPPPEEPLSTPPIQQANERRENTPADSTTGHKNPAKRKSANLSSKKKKKKKYRFTIEEDSCEYSANSKLVEPNHPEPMQTGPEVTSTPITEGRARRRCCQMGILSYAEPSLQSKLRRGDPFTDTALFKSPPGSATKKRRSANSSCKKQMRRTTLANLTNIQEYISR